jgi:hypothetical protein
MKQPKSPPIHYRHGDVLITRVSTRIPKAATKAPRAVLAEGEATGHAHRVETGAHMFVSVDGVRYLDVFDECATVTHEEHGPISLPRGRYVIGIQREYSPEGLRPVFD